MSDGLARIEGNVLNHDKLLGFLAAAEPKPKEVPVVTPPKKIEIGNILKITSMLIFSVSHHTTNSIRKIILGLFSCM
jgi:hypothetical protein